MNVPCLRRGIMLLAQRYVKSRSADAPILTRLVHHPISWLEVAELRERLLAMPQRNADEVLLVLSRSLDAKRKAITSLKTLEDK